MTVSALPDALADLPAEEAELRVRAKAALALELRWSAEPPALWAASDDAVDKARRSSPGALAETLIARYTLGHLPPSTSLRDAAELRRIGGELRDPSITSSAAIIAFDS